MTYSRRFTQIYLASTIASGSGAGMYLAHRSGNGEYFKTMVECSVLMALSPILMPVCIYWKIRNTP